MGLGDRYVRMHEAAVGAHVVVGGRVPEFGRPREPDIVGAELECRFSLRVVEVVRLVMACLALIHWALRLVP
jgi:hypothetical protein